MAIDVERLLSHDFGTLRQSYTRRDTILYALGIGLGADPVDEADLDYLLDTRDCVLPAFAGTLASPGMWIRDPAFGIGFDKLVHAEQAATFHRPLPSMATVEATPRVTDVFDRGPGRGAVVVVERTIRDADDRCAYATIRQTLLLRADGGFGGAPPPRANAAGAPDRDADAIIDFMISPRAALIYRLSGDLNPLHADPLAATAAGFPRPILHGLASYGLAAWMLERASRQRLRSMSCKFSGIVFPGDRLRLSIWHGQEGDMFSGWIDDRQVLSAGVSTYQVVS